MSIELIFYLADVINNIDNVLCVILTVLTIGLIVLSIVTFVHCGGCGDDESIDTIKSWWKLILKKSWIYFLIILFSVALPSKKTMYLMIGSHYLSKSDLPVKVSEAINLKLDGIIKGLRKEKDEKA